MTYESWFNEIRTTKMNKQNNQVKIYKMVLLLCMLDRGGYDWYKPVKADEIALRFYRYLTDNTLIRDISFGDKGKIQYHNTYDKKYIANLIKQNPMQYWKGSHTRYHKGQFWIDIQIEPKDYHFVYTMTRKICLDRIKKETKIDFDTRIDLQEEYIYLNKELEKQYVAETEKETIIRTRIGQGKFRNRLFERYNSCILCGIQHRNLLIASHIKPWSESDNIEKLDVENGFILCPNHDKLFDRGYLTIKDNGEIITSKEIETDIPKLNISRTILYDLSSKNKGYLQWHREKIYDRVLC